MKENFLNPKDNERLEAENQFLKMKLMLEKGAQFSEIDDGQWISPQIENEFLNNIIAFEKQFEEHKTIKIFDKIGKPGHFKPVSKMPDSEIDKAWGELKNYLNKYSIDLDVCSPNISTRELYRFATEELFEYEIEDMSLPGWTTNFIYDEFYPDPVYDNSRLVEQNLFHDIFRKADLFYEINYNNDGFVFNNKLYIKKEPFIKMINQFKSLFDEVELIECTTSTCEVKDTYCMTKGNYRAIAKNDKDTIVYKGDYKIELVLDEMGYWCFKNIQIDGFDPA